MSKNLFPKEKFLSELKKITNEEKKILLKVLKQQHKRQLKKNSKRK